MLTLLIVALTLLIVEVLVWRYGADSRDGNDWKVPGTVRQSPYIG